MSVEPEKRWQMICVEHVERGFDQKSDGRCFYVEHVEIANQPKVMAGETEHWHPVSVMDPSLSRDLHESVVPSVGAFSLPLLPYRFLRTLRGRL